MMPIWKLSYQIIDCGEVYIDADSPMDAITYVQLQQFELSNDYVVDVTDIEICDEPPYYADVWGVEEE